MNFETLKDPELQTRLREAKSTEEMLEIARECGMDLDDAQIEGVNGGAWCSDYCTDFAYCKHDGPL